MTSAIPTTIKERIDLKSARAWREFDTFVNRRAARFAAVAEQILDAELYGAARVYEEYGTEAAAVGAVDDREWIDYIARLYLTTVPDAARMVEEQLTKVATDVYIEAARRWLRANADVWAAGVGETSRKAISGIVTRGLREGLTREEIADRIRERRKFSKGRANEIARTAVHGASNYGSLTAVEEQGQAMQKIWISTPDGRTRDAHRGAQGQRRRLDQAFSVGGEQLMYPGDGSLGASAANLCNCRCNLAYQAVRRRLPRPRRRPAA